LVVLVENLPIGTNLALLHFFWMLISGALLPNRGALHPALKAIGLSEKAIRRAWAAFRGGAWSIVFLLHIWQTHIEGIPAWQHHEYEGYRPVGVDITAFWRPALQGCPSKYYHPQAGKALPAVIMGVVGQTGSINDQRLALPRDFIRVESEDPSKTALQTKLLQMTARKLQDNEIATLDAGFKISQVQAAGLDSYVIRLAKNFTARRNKVAPYKGRGRRPTYGEWVRPLARSYDGNEIPATSPDWEKSWEEDGRTIRAKVWEGLILPGIVPDPDNETFDVIVVYDPIYKNPWVLGTSIAKSMPTVRLKPESIKGLYQDRWPVEQIPLAAKHMVGAHRQFVFADESIHRLPELALLAGSIQSFLAATLPATPTGFWDRHPKRTPGRLRRVLAGKHFPKSYPLPGRIRKKTSVTDHLPKGIEGHRRAAAAP
jgi:hypothetical protein